MHSDIRIQKLRIGYEQAPLLVVDNFLANADDLVEQAARKTFSDVPGYFPGIRAKAPLTYQHFVIENLRDEIASLFGVTATSLRFTGCHFSLMTLPSERLHLLQRIPHLDSVYSDELALIYYLFKSDLGGTAFYRHRSTGFECVDLERNAEFCRHLNAELGGPHSPGPAYITADTPLFEQISAQEGRFNRLLIYRRNSLHSSNLSRDFVPDANPRTGRLSINGFLK